jgi:hypothetical protein
MLTEAGKKLVDGIAWPSALDLPIPSVWLGSGKRNIWFDGGLVRTIVYLIIIFVVLLPLCGEYVLRIMMAPDIWYAYTMHKAHVTRMHVPHKVIEKEI